MSKASMSHSQYKKFLERLTQKTASEASDVMMRLLREASLKKDTPDITKKFLSEIMNQGEKNFYLTKTQIWNEPSIGLISKNFKSIMFIALNTTDKKYLNHYKSSWILDLLHLHSYKKGEGRKMMEAFLHIHKNLNIPGSLWTETNETRQYFEKYGFQNLGNLGKSSEFLMKLPAFVLDHSTNVIPAGSIDQASPELLKPTIDTNQTSPKMIKPPVTTDTSSRGIIGAIKSYFSRKSRK